MLLLSASVDVRTETASRYGESFELFQCGVHCFGFAISCISNTSRINNCMHSVRNVCGLHAPARGAAPRDWNTISGDREFSR